MASRQDWNRRPGRSSKEYCSKKRRAALYARDGHRCVYCLSTGPLSLDHLKPRCKGGTHYQFNLVTACQSCNSRRSNSSVRGFCIKVAQETNQDWRTVYFRVRNQSMRAVVTT